MKATIEYYGDHCKSGVPVEDRRAFLESSLARGYPLVALCESNWRPLAIVGGGPSVRDDVDELRNWDGEIWAVNASLDWLLSHGIRVDGYACCDSNDTITQFLKNAPDATYYLSSTCHPDVFDCLEGKRIVVWHAGVNDLKYPLGHGVVGGGPTILTRAPMLAHCLGYRDVHIFGGDSSYDGDESHVYGGAYQHRKLFKVRLDGVVYTTEAEFLHQAAYFQAILDFFTERGARFTVHGKGLGPAMMTAKMHDENEILARANAA